MDQFRRAGLGVMVYRRLGWAGCDGVSPTNIIEVACGGLLVGMHFGGRRSGLCRGSEEGDLYWFVGMAVWCVWWVLIEESVGMVSLDALLWV